MMLQSLKYYSKGSFIISIPVTTPLAKKAFPSFNPVIVYVVSPFTRLDI